MDGMCLCNCDEMRNPRDTQRARERERERKRRREIEEKERERGEAKRRFVCCLTSKKGWPFIKKDGARLFKSRINLRLSKGTEDKQTNKRSESAPRAAGSGGGGG